jgi:signal transduction histidine kinase
MPIRTRLLLAFGAVTLLLGAPLAYGVHRLAELREIAVTLRTTQSEALAALGDLRTGLIEYDRQVRSYVIAPDPLFRAGMRDALEHGRDGARRLAVAGSGTESSRPVRWLDSLAALTVRLEGLVEARRTTAATEFVRTTVRPVLTEARATLDPIANDISRSSTHAAAEAQRISDSASRTALIATLVAVLLGGAVAVWTTVALTRPVSRLRTSMGAVARGVFVAPADLPYQRKDEIGELSRSFRAMSEQLAELERIRGEFLNMMSHDIKAPLNTIGGCAELIEEEAGEKLDRPQHTQLGMIREHVRLLTERVDRMLEVGRLEAGSFPIQLEPVPVVPTFGWVRSAFEPQARRKGIAFTVTVDHNAPAFVEVDPQCLHNEILGNLLSNAFKFTPEGGAVSVKVWGERERPSALHVAVIDSGVGIPEDELPFVFGKYYRVRNGERSDGVGLGLAIVRQLVEAHGGTVDVESRRGGGSIFHVFLPGKQSATRENGRPGEGPSHRFGA